MRYKFYTNSEKAWLAMLEDLKRAEKSIYLESWILTEDAITKEFFEVLKQKSREGVKVKIIVDLASDIIYGSVNKEEFKKAGAELLLFNRWLFYRSHRKVLIIDEAIAYTGGVNVSGLFAKWLDLHIRITGALVKSLLRSFSRVYRLADGKDPEILNIKTQVGLYRAKLWLIERWPFKGKSELKKYYKRKCLEAKEKIVIVTPYFFPHRWLIKSLREAASRGVKIEIIIPEKTDFAMTGIIHKIFANSMKNIASFFFIPEMNHAKVLLVDDREGLIGSNNIDAQSFDFNLEASVVFQRKDMVGDLKQILERWKKMAIPFEKMNYNHKWYHKFIEFLVKILQPIL